MEKLLQLTKRCHWQLLLSTWLICTAGHADQTDPRLDALFATLQQVDEPAVLARTESQIWAIWLEHPDATVERLLELGSAAMGRGDLGTAMLVFSEIIESEPEFAEGWNQRATLHYMAGDFAASLADIEQTLALEPRHFGALSGRGLVYVAQENLAAARQAFLRLLEVHPNSPNALNNLQEIEAQIRRNTI